MAITYGGNRKTSSARTKVIVAGLVGIVVAVLVVMLKNWQLAPLLAWDAAAIVYLVWIWLTIGRMDPKTTRHFAIREDPSRATADVIVTVASLGSLAGVGLILLQSGSSHGAAQLLQIGLAVISVVISWITVHTLFALRYAELFYKGKTGGVDFGAYPPSYQDFAYLAFTLGMTFQVSDTVIQNQDIRRSALRHALLSYVFGTVILASTINLVAGMSK
jgi:uncharacterized membrane protein